jgi:hypothetical protein
LGTPAAGTTLVRGLKESLPFLPKFDNKVFLQLPQFNITDGERRVFDLLVTNKPRNRAKSRLVKTWGFDTEFVQNYQNMIRYIPRYFESAW